MSRGKCVALYFRVSALEPSVENQRQELQRVAKQRGWKLAKTYVDRGIGGKGLQALARMRKDAAGARFDIVAAWSIDGLGHSLSHLAAVLHELQQIGVGVYLHQEKIDSGTQSGKAMLAMCGVFGKFERALHVGRIKAGQARAKAQGKKLGRPTISQRTEARVRELRRKNYGKLKIARRLRIGVSTVQRVLSSTAAR